MFLVTYRKLIAIFSHGFNQYIYMFLATYGKFLLNYSYFCQQVILILGIKISQDSLEIPPDFLGNWQLNLLPTTIFKSQITGNRNAVPLLFSSHVLYLVDTNKLTCISMLSLK